jgi:hypothetical protein
MGFKREKKVFNLVWPEGDENHGFEVRATSLPLGDFLKIANMAKFVKEENADTEQISELFQMFTYALVEWNLEEDQLVDGEMKTVPVPADIDGLYSQDLDFVMQIISAWVGAIGSANEELGKGSTSGDTSLEASIPTEAL